MSKQTEEQLVAWMDSSQVLDLPSQSSLFVTSMSPPSLTSNVHLTVAVKECVSLAAHGVVWTGA